MLWIAKVLVAVSLLTSQALADCASGDIVGPCVCIVDGNENLALECTGVTDGTEITDALEQIQVAQLASLDISDSPDLTVMPDAAFGTTAIQHMRFYTTGLTELAPAVFTSPTAESLQTLYVKHCSAFTALDTETVGVLTGLQELYVSSNSLTALSGALPATQLKYVDLSFNEIQSISEDYFAAATELTVVLLNFNALTSESLDTSQSFAAPNQDLYLSLGYNAISEGLLGINFTTKAPRELIMSGNGIADVTQEAFDGLMNQMGSQYEAPYILLDNNPLLCGCELEWVIEHPYRSLLLNAMCSNGQLVENLGPTDFADYCRQSQYLYRK